jgi:hypothetical protein
MKMGEKPRGERAELNEKLDKLFGTIKDLENGLASLKEQIGKLEKFKKVVEPNMWLINGVKAVLVLFAVFVVGSIGHAIYWYGSASTSLKQHDDSLAKLESKYDKISEEYRQSNAKLIQLIIERLPRTTQMSLLIHEGKILKATKGELVIQTADRKSLTFKLTAETEISVKGRDAKPEDLKPGMSVKVGAGDNGEAVIVEAQ